MRLEKWWVGKANHGRPVGHRKEFVVQTLSKIGSHWRATYVSILSPMFRIDLGAEGKSKGISKETTRQEKMVV